MLLNRFRKVLFYMAASMSVAAAAALFLKATAHAQTTNHIEAPELEKAQELEQIFNNDSLILLTESTEDTLIVYVGGNMGGKGLRSLRKTIDNLEKKENLSVVILNFLGGRDQYTFLLRDALVDKCPPESCNLRTILPASRACASACLYLFMIGEERIAASNGLFAFHATTDKGTILEGVAQERLQEAGVNKAWLDKNSNFFESVEFTKFRAHELYVAPEEVSEGHPNPNIVTKLIPVITTEK